MQGRVVTVFGGSGSIGRQLVALLADKGARVRVAVPDTEKAMFLKPLGNLGQIAPVAASVTNAESVKRAVAGADMVVNLVGILHEGGRKTFKAIHVDGAATVAKAAAAAGVSALVHVSALGASDKSASKYGVSKAQGEAAVKAAFPGASILRPSVVFGPNDGFFNLFAGFTRFLPALAYFTRDGFKVTKTADGGFAFDLGGSGGPKFQPVYVGDVTEAIVRILDNPDFQGRTYELGGPKVYSMKEIMDLVVAETQHAMPVLPLPFWVAKIQASILGLLPKPPFTKDQLAMMETDNVVSGALPGLADLGIEAQACEPILPTYLNRYRSMHRHMILRGNGSAPQA
jgi:NADH dehydrogenase